MRVLALVPNLPGHAPGQRTNIEAWAPHLTEMGIHVSFYPFETKELHGILYEPGDTYRKARTLANAYKNFLAEFPSPSDFDLLYVYREAALVGPALTERWLSWRKVPFVYAVDDPIFVPYRSPYQGSLSWLKFFKKAEKTCSTSAVTIVNSHPLKAWARQFCEDVVRIPSVVDVESYAMRCKQDNASLVIGWSGSPTTTSNLITILPILGQIQNDREVRLKAVGISGDKQDLEGVECLPWEASREVDEIKSFDIGLAPMIDNPWNHWKFSLKVAQYAAAGVPVVASPVGDIPNQVVDGVTGYLACNPDDWRNHICRLLDNPSLREQMGIEGERRAREYYSAEKAASSAAEVLKRAHASAEGR